MKGLPCCLVLIVALTAAGCGSFASASGPTYAPSLPTLVTGRVVALKKQGAWIDFDDAFVAYDSVVVEISAPEAAAGRRVYLQYQGEPQAHGHVIQPGQMLAFTLPVVPDSGCCEPYLEKLADLREVSASPAAVTKIAVTSELPPALHRRDYGDLKTYQSCAATPRRELTDLDKCEIKALSRDCTPAADCLVTCQSSPDGYKVGGGCYHICFDPSVGHSWKDRPSSEIFSECSGLETSPDTTSALGR